VTLIATRPEPVTVELRPPPGGGAAVPALASTCSYVGGGTNAAVRLDQFAASFPRNVRSDICTNDFTTPMIETARVIRQMTGDRCIGRPIPSGTECTVVAVRGALEEELQGWSLVADPTHCTAEGNLLLELTLPDPVPGDLLVSLRCRL
jgi:hypothetical protein